MLSIKPMILSIEKNSLTQPAARVEKRQRVAVRQICLALRVCCLLLLVCNGLDVQAHPATGIVIDHQGQIFFSDLEVIWKINTQGRLSVFRAGVSGRHVHELAIDDEDNIYGADLIYEPATGRWQNAVWKMTPLGSLNWLFTPADGSQGGASIWMDRAGNMYSVEQNNNLKQKTILLRRTPTGVLSTFAGGAFGQRDGIGTQARFSSIGGMAVGPDGDLFLTDGDAVRKVSMDARVTTVGKNLNFRTAADNSPLFAGDSSYLAGLAIDSANNVYVADGGNRRLLKIDSQGKVKVLARTEPPFFPTGVKATPAGDVYTLEVASVPPGSYLGPRVRKISVDGRIITIASVDRQTAGRSAGPEAQRFERAWLGRSFSMSLVVPGLIAIGASVLTMVMVKLGRRRNQS